MATDRVKRMPAAAARVASAASLRIHPDVVLHDEPHRPRDLRKLGLGSEIDPNEPTGIGVVARGRTVEAPIPGKKRRVGFERETGEEIFGPVLKRFGPGEAVRLPASEVRRLKELGFLVDASKAVPEIQTGRYSLT